MKQAVLISEKLYNQLTEIAEQQNINDIEHLIENWLYEWQSRANKSNARMRVVQQALQMQQQLQTKYGQMPDSTHLIRADREQR
ncbi:MAG: hypothetical protein OHK0052_13850 [Anaerolineales bacterium]